MNPQYIQQGWKTDNNWKKKTQQLVLMSSSPWKPESEAISVLLLGTTTDIPASEGTIPPSAFSTNFTHESLPWLNISLTSSTGLNTSFGVFARLWWLLWCPLECVDSSTREPWDGALENMLWKWDRPMMLKKWDDLVCSKMVVPGSLDFLLSPRGLFWCFALLLFWNN